MKKSFLLIIIAGLMWGTSGIFVNFLAPYGFSSLQMTAMRGLGGALGMVIYTLLTDRCAFRASPIQLAVYFFCGLMLFLTAYFYYTAIHLTSIATAAILMYTAPIFVTAYSVAFLAEKMTRLKLLSIAMMLTGCALVSGIVDGFAARPLGVLLGIGSGVCYAAYNIISKIGMRRGCAPKSASLWGFIFMALVSVPVSKPAEIVRLATDFKAWVLFALLGVVTFFVPYFLYSLSLKRMPAGTAASLGIVEPMSATVYAMIFFGEIPDVFGAIGIVIILSAVYMLGRAEGNSGSDGMEGGPLVNTDEISESASSGPENTKA